MDIRSVPPASDKPSVMAAAPVATPSVPPPTRRLCPKCSAPLPSERARFCGRWRFSLPSSRGTARCSCGPAGAIGSDAAAWNGAEQRCRTPSTESTTHRDGEFRNFIPSLNWCAQPVLEEKQAAPAAAFTLPEVPSDSPLYFSLLPCHSRRSATASMINWRRLSLQSCWLPALHSTSPARTATLISEQWPPVCLPPRQRPQI